MCEETWYGRDTYNYERVLRPRKRRDKMGRTEVKDELDTKFEAVVKGLLAGYLPDENSRDYVAFKIALLHRDYVEQEMSSSGE